MKKTFKIGRENENWLARYVYRKIAGPLVIQLSKINANSVQISVLSVITSVIAGIFFSLGSWKNLVFGYLFLQLTIVLDHTDGAIARYTGKQSTLGSWFDKFSAKLHKSFFVFGVTMGVYGTTNDPFYLILGHIANFLWFFSAYISETKKMRFKFKKDITLFKESKYKSVFPFTLLVTNVFSFLLLINQPILSLWFIVVISMNAFQQIFSVTRHWNKK